MLNNAPLPKAPKFPISLFTGGQLENHPGLKATPPRKGNSNPKSIYLV